MTGNSKSVLVGLMMRRGYWLGGACGKVVLVARGCLRVVVGATGAAVAGKDDFWKKKKNLVIEL